MKIYKTRRYNDFKFITGNRRVDEKNVKRLTHSILERNLLESRPITVNGKMEVIDGQHRLEVARLNKLPIYYTIEEDLDYTDVVRLNTGIKNWSYNDFLNLWIKKGHKDYEILKLFCDNYGLPVSVGIELLSRDAKVKGRDVFKNGEFKAGHLKQAEETGEAIKTLRSYTESGAWRSRTFIRAIVQLLKVEDFSLDRLVKKFSNGHIIKRQATSRDYLRKIEDIYNFKVREEHKIRLYG